MGGGRTQSIQGSMGLCKFGIPCNNENWNGKEHGQKGIRQKVYTNTSIGFWIVTMENKQIESGN